MTATTPLPASLADDIDGQVGVSARSRTPPASRRSNRSPHRRTDDIRTSATHDERPAESAGRTSNSLVAARRGVQSCSGFSRLMSTRTPGPIVAEIVIFLM